jgi:hypothetical protein
MNDYALSILENALRDEVIAKTDSVNYLLATHAYDDKVGSELTRKAFEESGRLADERIPQLQRAIKTIQLTGTDFDDVLTNAITDNDGRINPYTKIKDYLSNRYYVFHKG